MTYHSIYKNDQLVRTFNRYTKQVKKEINNLVSCSSAGDIIEYGFQNINKSPFLTSLLVEIKEKPIIIQEGNNPTYKEYQF